MEAEKDSRFFPGYTWVSDKPDCKAGLCMPSLDPLEAAKLYLRNELKYYNAGRTFVVYTMTAPGDEPTKVEVTV